MSPRSENRGYPSAVLAGPTRRTGRFNGSTVREPRLSCCPGGLPTTLYLLQWVHGPRTVVIAEVAASDDGNDAKASMGPRSENSGYRISLPPDVMPFRLLQWVHGPRTVVIWAGRARGEGIEPLQWVHGPRTVVNSPCNARGSHPDQSFNGSTVREPWLTRPLPSVPCGTFALQWVHGPRTVVNLVSLVHAPWPPS